MTVCGLYSVKLTGWTLTGNVVLHTRHIVTQRLLMRGVFVE